MHRLLHIAALLCLLAGPMPARAGALPADLQEAYARTVDRRLLLPEQEQRAYAFALTDALQDLHTAALASQYFVLVDRDPRVQAVMILWRSAAGEVVFVGASPASTGRPGGFEHFQTPVGV